MKTEPPPGWDEDRIRRVLEHYERQTEEQAVAEDEAPYEKVVSLAPGPFRRKDYEALPDEPLCELIYGTLYASPNRSVLHQVVLLCLATKMREIAQSARAWVFFAPLDVYLFDHSVVQPDIMYISAANRRIIRERIEGVPDLLVEILSPGMAARDRGLKLRLYAQAGVPEYWIVDPLERQIEFLRNEAGEFVVALPAAGVYRSQLLPEISLDIASFWREVEEDLTAPAAD